MILRRYKTIVQGYNSNQTDKGRPQRAEEKIENLIDKIF